MIGCLLFFSLSVCTFHDALNSAALANMMEQQTFPFSFNPTPLSLLIWKGLFPHWYIILFFYTISLRIIPYHLSLRLLRTPDGQKLSNLNMLVDYQWLSYPQKLSPYISPFKPLAQRPWHVPIRSTSSGSELPRNMRSVHCYEVGKWQVTSQRHHPSGISDLVTCLVYSFVSGSQAEKAASNSVLAPKTDCAGSGNTNHSLQSARPWDADCSAKASKQLKTGTEQHVTLAQESAQMCYKHVQSISKQLWCFR